MSNNPIKMIYKEHEWGKNDEPLHEPYFTEDSVVFPLPIKVGSQFPEISVSKECLKKVIRELMAED